MVPRVRSKSRQGWPDNLYPNRDGFKYRHPVTRKEHYMGKDKAKAFAAAKKLNVLLSGAGDLVGKVITAQETVRDALAIFRREEMPSRNWGDKTRAWREVYLNRIEQDLGDQACAEMTVKAVAEYVRGRTESERSRQVYRETLVWVFACAVEEGWIDINPAEATRKHRHERKRERLTIEAYKAIHAEAPKWLQNAMDLSLLTLQRREDVAALRFEDWRDGALWLMPQKTAGSTGVRLRIESPDLTRLIARCRDALLSPFIIHRRPDHVRSVANRAVGRIHHTQVMPEIISRAFATAREVAGHGTGAGSVTFHEIRSLGGALLREQGWSTEQIQALMGHASQAMTEHYLGGHEQPWQQVTTGTLPRL